MKIKYLLAVLPAVLLMSCGGSEEADSTEENEESEEVAVEYNSTFEECGGATVISMTADSLNDSDAFAFAPIDSTVDISTFVNCAAELSKDHDWVSIKFVNNPDVQDSGLGSYSPTDLSLTIDLKVKDGEIIAGEFSEDNSEIKLTKGSNPEGTMKTQGVGSNKTTRTATINSISEEHVCGSFAMTNEEGKVIIEASFDADITMMMF
jgi:hypothetical protein